MNNNPMPRKKGDYVNCVWCGESFIAKSSTHYCCPRKKGQNSTCSQLYSRWKKGQGLPDFNSLKNDQGQQFRTTADQVPPERIITDSTVFNIFENNTAPTSAPTHVQTPPILSPPRKINSFHYQKKTMVEELFDIVLAYGVPLYVGKTTKKMINQFGIQDDIMSSVAGVIGGMAANKIISPRIQLLVREHFNFNAHANMTSIEQLEYERNNLLTKLGEVAPKVLSINSLGNALIGAIGLRLTANFFVSKPEKTKRTFVDGKIKIVQKTKQEYDLEIMDYENNLKTVRNQLSLYGGGAGLFFNRLSPHFLSGTKVAEINQRLEEIEKEITTLSTRNDIVTDLNKRNITSMVDVANNGDTTYRVNEDELGKYMTAREYRKLDIPSIDFAPQFKYLFGSPGTDFYMIVTGSPGHGKTTFLAQFGEYLHKHHGKTLYLPAEQPNANKDFQTALDRLNLNHVLIAPLCNTWNLERVITEVQNFNIKFLICDSINYMEFSPNDIKEFRRRCPDVAFLAVLQSTKTGNFRGSQEYKHDCDIFVEIKNFQVVQEKARGQEAAASVPIEQLFSD